MPASLPIRLRDPDIACFLDPESRNFNNLVLISRLLARDAEGAGAQTHSDGA
jgi:hypothetical protein